MLVQNSTVQYLVQPYLSSRSRIHGAMTLSITTLSITTLSITTLSITALSITPLSIMTLNIMGLFMTLSIDDTQHNDPQQK